MSIEIGVKTDGKMAKNKLGKNGSSTAGILKGPNCHKSSLKTRMSKDSRFYKTDPNGYIQACLEVDKLHPNKSRYES